MRPEWLGPGIRERPDSSTAYDLGRETQDSKPTRRRDAGRSGGVSVIGERATPAVRRLAVCADAAFVRLRRVRRAAPEAGCPAQATATEIPGGGSEPAASRRWLVNSAWWYSSPFRSFLDKRSSRATHGSCLVGRPSAFTEPALSTQEGGLKVSIHSARQPSTRPLCLRPPPVPRHLSNSAALPAPQLW
jgi:hypothetical protein